MTFDLRLPFQYMFQMVEKDEAYFFLTQKTARDMVTTVSSTGLLHFGFTILKVGLTENFVIILTFAIDRSLVQQVETNRQYRVHRLDLAKVVQSSEFKNARSIFMRTTLKRGRYVLIPCTFEAGIEGQFHLRMFTPRSNLARWVKTRPFDVNVEKDVQRNMPAFHSFGSDRDSSKCFFQVHNTFKSEVGATRRRNYARFTD